VFRPTSSSPADDAQTVSEELSADNSASAFPAETAVSCSLAGPGLEAYRGISHLFRGLQIPGAGSKVTTFTVTVPKRAILEADTDPVEGDALELGRPGFAGRNGQCPGQSSSRDDLAG
jgi:hypothetical protein